MAENGTPAMSLASLVSLPQSSKPGATFFSALAQWEKEHGLGGRPREFGRIEQGRVGQRARSYTQTPRHVQYRCIQIPAAWERAGGLFRAHARRGSMRAGRGSIGSASILVARRWAALGWWHAACWAKRRRRSAAGRSAWHAREVARAIDKQFQRRAPQRTGPSRVTAVRGLIASRGVWTGRRTSMRSRAPSPLWACAKKGKPSG